MKILVVCQYYYPEPVRIADICEELVKQGHEVDVITGVPNYPEGKIYKEYKYRKRRNETINGVNVQRCFTIGRRHSVIFRILNYYSFVISSTVYASRLREEYDVILVNQLSPVMMASAAIRYKKKYKKRLIMYCLDLWPESLIAGGIKKGSIIYRIFHRVSKKMYMHADRILVSSKEFSSYFNIEFGINNTEYLPQYAEEIFDEKKCKKIANETLDLMFAGNIGTAQSIDTIIYAADKTKDLNNLYWHIVGGGSDLERIQELSRNLELSNVIFHGRQPLEKMPTYYSMADAMIVTMEKDDFLSMTLPGKVQTYLAAGKPIIGAVSGETSNLITRANCGLCCDANDAEGLANLAREFSMKQRHIEFSDNAKSYYHKTFSKDVIMAKLNTILIENIV